MSGGECNDPEIQTQFKIFKSLFGVEIRIFTNNFRFYPKFTFGMRLDRHRRTPNFVGKYRSKFSSRFIAHQFILKRKKIYLPNLNIFIWKNSKPSYDKDVIFRFSKFGHL